LYKIKIISDKYHIKKKPSKRSILWVGRSWPHVQAIVGVEMVNDGIGVCHIRYKDGVRYPTGKQIGVARGKL
jgi:hypothetical protein